MAAQDLYARQPVPEIGPEEYGLPPLGPPPSPPQTGLTPQEQRRRQMIAISSALAALIGGPAGRGIVSGTATSFEQQDRAVAERDTQMRTEHRLALGQYAAQQQAYQGELERRQGLYQQNVKALRTLAPTVKTKADMDRFYDEFAAGMQQLGLRVDRNRLSQAVRWIAPKARERAQEYIDRWMKRPDAKELLTHSDLLSQIPVEFDWDGDEIPEQGRFLTDVMALADMPPHLTASGQAIVPPTETNDRVAQHYQNLLTMAAADGKDVTDVTLKDQLLLQAQQDIENIRPPKEPPTVDPTLQATRQLNLDLLRDRAQTAAEKKATEEAAKAKEAAIPSTYRDLLRRALSMASPARAAEARALAADLWNPNDPSEFVGYVRQAAIETQPVAQRAQITGRLDAVAALRDIRAMLDELQRQGVSTNILRGTTEDVARRLGTSTNPALATIGARINMALFNYRLAVSGVQFSYKENEQYQALFPNYRNTLPLNRALLDGLEQAMQTNDREFWRRQLGPAGAKLVEQAVITPQAAPSSGVPSMPSYDEYLRGRGAR